MGTAVHSWIHAPSGKSGCMSLRAARASSKDEKAPTDTRYHRFSGAWQIVTSWERPDRVDRTRAWALIAESRRAREAATTVQKGGVDCVSAEAGVADADADAASPPASSPTAPARSVDSARGWADWADGASVLPAVAAVSRC